VLKHFQARNALRTRSEVVEPTEAQRAGLDEVTLLRLIYFSFQDHRRLGALLTRS
jgi:hypothetical protein